LRANRSKEPSKHSVIKMNDFKMITGLKGRDPEIFADLLKTNPNYLEYGCGTSTQYVDQYTTSKALIVETDHQWIEKISKTIRRKNDLNFIHVDLGPVSGWGYPKEIEKYKNKFEEYYKKPWESNDDFDLILIDGRFRVATFLYCLLKAKKGTIIILDDYKDRDYYRVVEKFIQPISIYERMAKFIKNEEFDEELILKFLDQYKFDLR
jgi:cellulose biosynthesis protein BcsQ